MAEQVDEICDIVAGEVASLSLHTTNGGSTGTDEISGGSYARQTPSYGTASGGTADLDSNVSFNGPGTSSDVTHVGFWDSTPTWLGSSALSQTRTVGTNDTLVITSAPVSVS